MTCIFCRDILDWLAELDLNQHESDKEGQKWLQSETVMMSKVMNTTVMRRVTHSTSFKCIEAAYGNLYQNTGNMHSYLAVQQDNLINWIIGWNHKIKHNQMNCHWTWLYRLGLTNHIFDTLPSNYVDVWLKCIHI